MVIVKMNARKTTGRKSPKPLDCLNTTSKFEDAMTKQKIRITRKGNLRRILNNFKNLIDFESGTLTVYTYMCNRTGKRSKKLFVIDSNYLKSELAKNSFMKILNDKSKIVSFCPSKMTTEDLFKEFSKGVKVKRLYILETDNIKNSYIKFLYKSDILESGAFKMDDKGWILFSSEFEDELNNHALPVNFDDI
jgi:hypothetical protein